MTTLAAGRRRAAVIGHRRRGRRPLKTSPLSCRPAAADLNLRRANNRQRRAGAASSSYSNSSGSNSAVGGRAVRQRAALPIVTSPATDGDIGHQLHLNPLPTIVHDCSPPQATPSKASCAALRLLPARCAPQPPPPGPEYRPDSSASHPARLRRLRRCPAGCSGGIPPVRRLLIRLRVCDASHQQHRSHSSSPVSNSKP